MKYLLLSTSEYGNSVQVFNKRTEAIKEVMVSWNMSKGHSKIKRLRELGYAWADGHCKEIFELSNDVDCGLELKISIKE